METILEHLIKNPFFCSSTIHWTAFATNIENIFNIDEQIICPSERKIFTFTFFTNSILTETFVF